MSDIPTSRKRRGTKHDKTGCLTCRHRRKKCEPNTFPTCGSCVRLNLECIREHPKRLVPSFDVESDSSREVSTPMSSRLQLGAIFIAPPIVTAASFGRASSRRIFLKYYIDFLAHKMTASQQHNSFLSVLLPLAVESSTLLAALIALASGNLSNFNKTYRLAALEARSQALIALGKTVASPLEDIHECESALASCLILSTSEAILGQRSGWSEHLIGAKMIVQTARVSTHDGLLFTGPDAFKTNPEGQWLLRNFAYHDILGSVTTRRPPLISGLYLRSMADVVDSYMGVHVEVLVFISQISSLDLSIAHAEDVLIQSPLGTLAGGSTKICNLGKTWNSCYSLEQDIRAWQPRGLDPILNSMALAYKGSSLVYLYQRMRQYLRDACLDLEVQHLLSHIRTMISIEVSQILDSIVHIPFGAHAECIMLFPLFMAGGEAIHPRDMETVRARLRLIDETRGFRNIQRASEVLEEVWAASLASADTRQVDWYNVLERQGGGLLLT